MDSCKIIYFVSILVHSIFFYTGDSYLGDQYAFTWPRYLFILSVLLLLEKYDLVPSVLKCPPLFMVYKVIAAIVFAHGAEVMVWLQVEDILVWVMNRVGSMLKYIPGLEDKKFEFEKDDFGVWCVCLLVTSYLLLWVLVSSGYLPRMKGSTNTSAGNPATNLNTTRRRRSKARC